MLTTNYVVVVLQQTALANYYREIMVMTRFFVFQNCKWNVQRRRFGHQSRRSQNGSNRRSKCEIHCDNLEVSSRETAFAWQSHLVRRCLLSFLCRDGASPIRPPSDLHSAIDTCRAAITTNLRQVTPHCFCGMADGVGPFGSRRSAIAESTWEGQQRCCATCEA